jgi:putative NADH-flavin reductase
MRVALIGASGRAGSEILKELISRGHEVTAIARNDRAIADHPFVTKVSADVTDRNEIDRALRGHDTVISSARFSAISPGDLLWALKRSGVERLLIVGGAGSLNAAPGVRLLETPGFPDAYKPEALAGAAYLDALRAEKEINWTMLSPSASFFSGRKTGTFRIDEDDLLTAADGKSSISFADFATALVDELETPRYPRARFTVGY